MSAKGPSPSFAKGAICIVASAFGFALMAFFVRLCDDFGEEISSFQKSFFRNLVALAIAAFVFAKERAPAAAAPGRKAALLILGRSVAGCVGIFANFYALSKIPIGEAMALNKTAPFFTVLFSWIFLGERADAKRFAWIALAFAGAALVMKPGIGGGSAFATFCALLGGLGAGVAYTCVRELGVLRVDGALIVLAFSAFSCAASVPFMALDFRPMTAAQVAILLGAGAGAALGQFGVTAAYRFAPPRDIAVYDYSSVVFTAVFGWFFFAQSPDVWSVAGFAAIVAAAWFSRKG